MPLGSRGGEVVADRRLVGEELLGHHRAHRVQADVLRADRAGAVAVEAGQGVGAAGLELAAEDVALRHEEIIARKWRTTLTGMAVLGTKLHVPLPRRRLVTRTRLTDRLVDRARGRGPGWCWSPRRRASARRHSSPSGSRRAAPGSPGSRWTPATPTCAGSSTHLVAAVRLADPSLGADATALLESDRPPAPRTCWPSLVDDLDTLAGPTVLALDDYHVVDATEVHEAVTFLLDNLPPQVTLAITTRADPPLPLARLRARGELLEVRAADLRFTEAEATPSSTRSWGSSSRPHHVAALEHRTEGWATGCSSRPCRHGARGRDAGRRSSRRSPAATASSSTTSSRRCSRASPRTSGRSCSTPPSSTT